MKTTFRIALFCVLISFSSMLFAEDETNRQQFMTIKAFGGYNMWILGSAFMGSSTVTGLSMGGFSFGGDVLFLNPKGLQLGISVAYLPMMTMSISGVSAGMTMIPLTADIVLNSGFFYSDFGLGIAFMSANVDFSAIGGGTTNAANPTPGFLLKTGIGFNFKIVEFFGLDIGATLYLPISDFSLSGGLMNPFLGIITFSQFNLRAGICFYI